ncbi:MAG TPA: creatininase family protein [Acidimicrobiales bacterium]|nr:creatininase family protein [Acidimicrobiales bacterium]
MRPTLFDTPVRWDSLTWPEMAAVVAARPPVIGLLPVGATEQHGPHLPAGTDTVIATALCEAVSLRTGAVVLPALPIGCSFGHGTVLPGTLTLTPEQLSDTVREVVASSADSGITRILAVNGHFGNQAALAVARDHIRRERPDVRFGAVHWWSLTPDITAQTLADGEDVHANRAETSLMLAIAPRMVRMDELVTADDEDRTEGLVFGYTAPVLSRNGVTGRPSEATESLGTSLLEMVVEHVCDMVERGRHEEPPLSVPAQVAAL